MRWTSKKFWKYVINFVLNAAIVNSCILYGQANRPACISHGNKQLHYKINIMKQMMGNISVCKRVGRDQSLLFGTASPKTLHSLEKTNGNVKT